jgi:spermidine/putrescine transport system substrate-binding protein
MVAAGSSEELARRLASAGLSRRGFLRGLGGAVALGGLAACSTEGAAKKAAPSSGTAGAAASKPQDFSAAEKRVVFSNWPLYIDVDAKQKSVHPTLQRFTKSTGISVKYTEDINDNDQFFGKVRPQLAAGQDTGRDLIVLTDWMAARLIRLGWAQKLDKANLPNARNLTPALVHPGFDPNRDYTMPWQTGLTGISYNPKATGGKEIRTIDELLTDRSLKGRVTLLTEMRDTMGLILLSLGKDPANFTDADFSAAIEKLQRAVKSKQIRQFTGNEYAQDLAAGNIAAAVAWSGDVVQLQADDPRIKFMIPDSGATIWSDNLMIPNKARHKANAERLINYYYDPTVAATVADEVNYICPVSGAQAAMKKIDPPAAANPLIFPTAAALAKTHIFKALSTAEEATYNKDFQAVIGA